MLLYIWIGLGLATGMVGNAKGRNFFLWTFYGLLGPIVGLTAALLLAPERKRLERRALERGDARKCPSCAELVQREARVCKHCREPLPERAGFRQANFSG